MEKIIKADKCIMKVNIANGYVSMERLQGTIGFLTCVNILSQLLVPIANKNKYERKCPFKYEFIKNEMGNLKGLNILFAETNKITGYNIKEKKVFDISNSGKIKSFDNVFMYDILDFLVWIGIATSNVYEGYKLPYIVYPYEEVKPITAEELDNDGFINIWK